MEQFKRAKVIMLPTKNKSIIALTGEKLVKINESNYGFSHIKSQHLYITSDDEIKANDWIIDLDTNEVIKALPKWGYYNCKKVIATTDTSLLHPNINIKSPLYNILGENFKYLPQPSQQFIEKYIEEYNKGNIITDVLVEYEHFDELGNYIDNNYHFKGDIWKLKINSKDNTITIKKIKDSFSLQEMKHNLRSVIGLCKQESDFNLEDWINKNL